MPAPAISPPPRPRRRWPLVVAATLFLLGVAVAASAVVTVPYYASSPGQVGEVADLVTVDGDTYPAKGDLYFLTVSQAPVSAFAYLEALVDGQIDLRPRERVLPRGVTSEQRKRQGLDDQEEAKRQAIFVALTRLGYEATFRGDGALVTTLYEGSPAFTALRLDDLIVAVNGVPVGLATDAVNLLAGTSPGDRVVLTVQRLTDVGEETIEVPLVLGTHPDDASRGFVGVALDTFNLQTEFPIDIAIDSQNIGGPSAGLMYTLAIMNLLTEDDMTKGHRIAGTGTIRSDGDVGPIGGVRQKVYAARTAGAEYVLVPTENAADAATAAGDEVEIVAVDTVDDALAFLESLPPAG